MLKQAVFQQINSVLGPLEMDRFASRLTKQLPRFYSWRPDPEAEATDAFMQDWAACRGFANPPWCLIHRCLTKLKKQVARIVLITPLWKTQPWYPLVLELLEDFPRRIPHQSDLVAMPQGQEFLMQQRVPQLVAWPIRQSYSSRGFSSQASDLMLASWRDKTNSNYSSSFSRWCSWCQPRGRDPLSGPIDDVVNFLADLFSQGYQYQSLNAYRSAISSTHENIDGVSVGNHPAVTRLLKGVFHTRPPQPRYASFWDVGVVIQHIKILGPNKDLSLKQLTMKTVMLLALTRPSRSADLSKLDIQMRSFTSNGVVFRPLHLAKQSRSSRPIADFFFPSFPEDSLICPMVTLKAYEERTIGFRANLPEDSRSRLFLSWIGKHDPVSSCTIARWLKCFMKEAGIDISIFKAHSVRGASCSSAVGAGVTTKDILDKGGPILIFADTFDTEYNDYN